MANTPPQLTPSTSDTDAVVGPDNQNRLSRLFYGTMQEITVHTLVMAASLGSIWLIHFLLVYLVGVDKKFFDLIPVRWVTDAGDLLVIGNFLVNIFKGFIRKEQ